MNADAFSISYGTILKILWQIPTSEEELTHDLQSLESLNNQSNKKTLRKECCAYLWKLVLKGKINPERIIRTGFFHGMRCEKRACQFSHKINLTALNILQQIEEKSPSQEVREWFSSMLWDSLPRDKLMIWSGMQNLGVNPVLFQLHEHEEESKIIFPGNDWEINLDSGWDPVVLKGIKTYAKKQGSSSYMIIQGGKIVDQLGNVSEKHLVHSCRKSFLSALIGIYVDQGVINLSKTLKELGVDDTSSLSEKEKNTTLLDMIRSRSGVYHPAAYETPGMKDARPKRNSYQPGEFWYYNNWDFNALGKIFEELTGTSIFSALEILIAKPIGMQDFSAATDGDYRKEPESEYPSYDFFMSARDMARFGYLFLRNGRWQDQQIISKEWIDRSTMSYTQGTSTERNPFYGYGFMWWTNELGYYALGAGGHAIAVIPSKDLVIVHRMANDDEYDKELAVITPQATNTILRMVVDGAPT